MFLTSIDDIILSVTHQLQDLKQLSSWTSKDRLTTQVIYDETTRQYAAIFNEKKIRLWSAEETDLNNIKAYKFKSALHTILTLKDCPPVLVRKDGATASLERAIQNRKSWSKEGILNINEKILDCHLIRTSDKINLCMLTEIEGTYKCVVVRLNNETYSEEIDYVKRMELKRRSEELVGHTVLQAKNKACLLTLCKRISFFKFSFLKVFRILYSFLLYFIQGHMVDYIVIL